jgi:hypothetical protein
MAEEDIVSKKSRPQKLDANVLRIIELEKDNAKLARKLKQA